MNMTPEEKKIGQDNYHEAVSTLNRRAFMKGAAAAVPGLGALYFGYKELNGSPVKVGFIGTGDEGSVLLTQHPPAYMDIVAIADLRPKNQKRAFDGDPNSEARIGLRKKLGAEACAKIKTYANHKELLKNHPEIEAVVIAVPLNVHASVTIDCLKAGKHVLCEKLMAHNITECKQMIREAEAAKKLLAVGHQRHYSVLYENANELVQGGLLGDIKHIRACWHRNNAAPNKDGWNPKIDPVDVAALEKSVKEWGFDSVEQLVKWRLFNKTGGGLMAELGSHQLDACSIFLGKKHPLSIQGYGGRNFYGVKGVGSPEEQKDKREIDDHVYVTLEFPGRHYQEDHDDIVVVTYSSINTNKVEPYGETIYGSRGTMITELEQEVMLFKESEPGGAGGKAQRLTVDTAKGPAVLKTADTNGPAIKGATSGGAGGKVSRGYTEEMEHLCFCIRENNFEPREKGGLRCNGTHAMGDAIMALTANLALKKKKRIEFKESWFDPKSDDAPETDPQVVG